MALIPEVPREDWRRLHQAAVDFHAPAPWNWMTDDLLFGVQDPDSAEIGYSCILGNLGEVFGLAVYRGPEGYSAYARMASDEAGPGKIDALRIQFCLTAFFEGRNGLEPADRKIIKDLGLKYRGDRAWPLFRSQRPDEPPWFLEAKEARFLAAALDQAAHVARCVQADPDFLTPPRKHRNSILCRVPLKSESGTILWNDRWIEPEHPPDKPVEPAAIDEIRAQRLAGTARRVESAWEIDLLTMPTAVMDRERPYLLRTLFCADARTGFLLTAQPLDPGTLRQSIVGEILKGVEASKIRPAVAHVRTSEARDLLTAPLAKLGIDVRLVPRLPAVEEAETEFYRHFGVR